MCTMSTYELFRWDWSYILWVHAYCSGEIDHVYYEYIHTVQENLILCTISKFVLFRRDWSCVLWVHAYCSGELDQTYYEYMRTVQERLIMCTMSTCVLFREDWSCVLWVHAYCLGEIDHVYYEYMHTVQENLILCTISIEILIMCTMNTCVLLRWDWSCVLFRRTVGTWRRSATCCPVFQSTRLSDTQQTSQSEERWMNMNIRILFFHFFIEGMS